MTGKLGRLTRTYASVQRYRQILFVLIKYGFDDLIATLKVEKYLGFKWNPFSKKRSEDVDRMSRAARIRLVLEELGPTFTKMGQALSTRSDLLPDDILEELAKLQDRVKPFPFEDVAEIVSKELEVDLEEAFPQFEPEPIAAGSIGQVHRAQLADGTHVAVKVQRPGIRKRIEVDLEILGDMAYLIENNMEIGHIHRPTKVVDEFSRTIRKELDYSVEAANVERFAQIFEDESDVFVHQLFREQSTTRILTFEYVEGIKPTNLDLLITRGLDPVIIARKGAEQVMAQVFMHGFFHGDPHPGNLLVKEDNVICFLDFGMMGRIDRNSRETFADLLLQIVQRNEAKVAEALLKITHSHGFADRSSLERDISELLDLYLHRHLKDIEIGVLIQQLLTLTVKFELGIPAPYFLLIKAVTQIEDLGRRLDPEFDFVERAGPFVKKIVRDRYNPKRIARNFYETGSDVLFLIKDVPGEIRELLKQAKRGKMKIELEHLGLKPLLSTFEKVSNRISSAIVLASLIVGSSVIVLSGVPPKWNDIPLIGLAGFLFSGILGLALVRSISKDHNK